MTCHLAELEYIPVETRESLDRARAEGQMVKRAHSSSRTQHLQRSKTKRLAIAYERPFGPKTQRSA